MFSGYLLVALAALLWGMIGPLSKLAIQEGMTPLEVAFWRASMAWVLYAGHALALRRVRVDLKDLPWVGLFGVACIFGLFASYVLAVRAGGAALASVLLYTAPAWVALLAWKFLKERMTAVKLIAVAATLAGVTGVSLGHGLDGPVNTTAIAMGLLSGLTYALYYIFGKLLLGRYPTPTIFLYALPVGAACMTPFFDFGPRSPAAWTACAVLAAMSTYGAYSLYYAGLRRIEASRAAVIATLEPVVAALLAFSLFDERFTPLGYAGSALILAAVLLTILGGRRPCT
ncbi:putative inner membrane transporter YicL [Fundidesulfovibrio magnetotacticus]|uniref:Putative inner membrane transporter YicL n=1 Tax=Fundidesulfovibrio magnetotacticus TaxID=2730080 RepID=A0A6V8LWK8_9BACT|nr:DMT family transporter [Fundidesulfovibrio magnetotacticus]GFK92655.1 putative inner membrane transporter YicL [Fundidesulfovibrio magnetotacticus]